jgi:hypothetical protein
VENDDDWDWDEEYDDTDELNDVMEEMMSKGRTICIGLIGGVLKDKGLMPDEKGDIIREIGYLMEEKTETAPESKYFIVDEDGELLI